MVFLPEKTVAHSYSPVSSQKLYQKLDQLGNPPILPSTSETFTGVRESLATQALCLDEADLPEALWGFVSRAFVVERFAPIGNARIEAALYPDLELETKSSAGTAAKNNLLVSGPHYN